MQNSTQWSQCTLNFNHTIFDELFVYCVLIFYFHFFFCRVLDVSFRLFFFSLFDIRRKFLLLFWRIKEKQQYFCQPKTLVAKQFCEEKKKRFRKVFFGIFDVVVCWREPQSWIYTIYTWETVHRVCGTICSVIMRSIHMERLKAIVNRERAIIRWFKVLFDPNRYIFYVYIL